jgi:hypothetical protein
MGMDVYGRKPKDKKGEYFRNNVWFWHPLWDYCLKMHPIIASKCKEGHSNSGDGLNASDSKKLAVLIKRDLDSGKAELYAKEYKEFVDNIPKETCFCCKGGGKSLVASETLEDGAKEVQKEAVCHVCKGEGKTDSWYKYYHFSIDNLREWQEFLDNCGGFNIH